MGLSDNFVALMYLGFLVLGFAAPFVASLGYLWVDVFFPQFVSKVLTGQPVAMVMGAATVITYLLMDRRSPPRLTLTTNLTLLMAVWVTLTTTWAVVPDEAWIKWDWAFKTIAFSALVPFFIRSRVQIEAFIQVFAFACAIHIVPFGAKAILSGGGYGKDLGFLQTNNGLEEGSTLSALAIMFIPILLHLRRHSLLIADKRWRNLIYGAYIFFCFTAPIATVARTAIVGYAVVATFIWLQSRHKLAVALLIIAATSGLIYGTSNTWKTRIATIDTGEDASAQGRLEAWKWTLNFVGSHPGGGGFNSFMASDTGTAFHSIYFEVLGEHGWLGLTIFLGLILNTIVSLRRISQRSRDSPDLAWCRDLARAMFCGLMVILACGAFIGIAFQPLIWYLFALTTCISEYVRRALAPAATPKWSPRGLATHGAAAARLAR
jgi:probable O-glycosylation ligase (exosortase A-associated)